MTISRWKQLNEMTSFNFQLSIPPAEQEEWRDIKLGYLQCEEDNFIKPFKIRITRVKPENGRKTYWLNNIGHVGQIFDVYKRNFGRFCLLEDKDRNEYRFINENDCEIVKEDVDYNTIINPPDGCETWSEAEWLKWAKEHLGEKTEFKNCDCGTTDNCSKPGKCLNGGGKKQDHGETLVRITGCSEPSTSWYSGRIGEEFHCYYGYDKNSNDYILKEDYDNMDSLVANRIILNEDCAVVIRSNSDGSRSYKPETVSAVNHPAHYGGADNPYEAIEVIEAWQLGFNLGNTVKYISRAGKKFVDSDVWVAKKLEDLEKAKWYLEREIENLKKNI